MQFFKKANAMYKIKKIRKGYIVVNTSTGKHAHFRSLFGCKCIIYYLTNNIEITNPYLQVSAERLKNKEKKKDKYVNKRLYKVLQRRGLIRKAPILQVLFLLSSYYYQ